MTLYRVTGVCLTCNKHQKTEGMGNEEDALLVFHQEHMVEHGHWFKGDSIVSTYEEERVEKPQPRYRGRRR